MRRTILVGLLVLVTAAFGVFPACDGGGGGGGGNGTTPTTPQILTGTWAGTVKRTNVSPQTYTFQLILTQSASNISGSGVLAFGGTTWDGDFTGTVSNPTGGGTINFAFSFMDSGTLYTLSFTGNYTTTTMTGNWTAQPSGNSGTFKLNKL